MLFSLPELYEAYKRWVSENPMKVTDFEMSAKWASYIIAGRINDSHILSELVYCLSNLLVFFNDRIISKTNNLEMPSSGDKLKHWLTVLEYCEVFLELSAKKIWGTAGKWLIIISIQTFKCISRLLLVYKHKECIVQTPPILPLQRNNLKSSSTEQGMADLAQYQMDTVSSHLKRSGKLLRRVDVSPPIYQRDWKPVDKRQFDSTQTIEQALAGQQLIAETIYICKPMVHLGAMACFGTNTWKPWSISFIMDLLSLHLYNKTQKVENSLTNKQKLQVSRRIIGLLFYLLRSPFYDRYSKARIETFLLALANNVPLAGYVCNPLHKYLPFWQSNYFYTWST